MIETMYIIMITLTLMGTGVESVIESREPITYESCMESTPEIEAMYTQDATEVKVVCTPIEHGKEIL